ncbi:MAG: FAD:protein FMN transferase [Verrucomicrobiota bacterium]|jgi:FAD:protein FMN transferase|nr:FAD:protein FMN transferase [Verrucomicrobiota bacterium]
MLFLRSLGLVSSIYLLCLDPAVAANDSGCESSLEWKKHVFHRPQMGVPFRLTFYSNQGEEHAESAADGVWKRISALNAIFSNYETDSELSQLGYNSGKGDWVPVSDPLWKVLCHAQQLSMQSDGAFDLTLGPATALWRKARRQKSLPAQTILESMMSRTGWKKLLLRPENQSVCLVSPGMRLDPGGIAKGFALDSGLAVLSDFGIRHALLAGGGDMAALEGHPNGKPWTIRLAGFDDDDPTSEDMIPLVHAAVATSGDLFQFVEIDKLRYSHILNPKTGIGLTTRSLVTVYASSGMEADSLATTLAVLGPKAAPEWIERFASGVKVRLLWLDEADTVQEWVRGDFERISP